jgi:hypothetical protein
MLKWAMRALISFTYIPYVVRTAPQTRRALN